MSSANAVLSAEQGAYQWGTRDCLTTLNAMIEYQLGEGRGIDMHVWHGMSEPRAMAKAKKAYGSLADAHIAILQKLPGIKVLDGKAHEAQPGDIVQLEGRLATEGSGWDTQAGAILGFVADTHEIFHWTPARLAPLGQDSDCRVAVIFRCRQP